MLQMAQRASPIMNTHTKKKKLRKTGGVKCKLACRERSKGMEVCVDGRCGELGEICRPAIALHAAYVQFLALM